MIHLLLLAISNRLVAAGLRQVRNLHDGPPCFLPPVFFHARLVACPNVQRFRRCRDRCWITQDDLTGPTCLLELESTLAVTVGATSPRPKGLSQDLA